MRLSLYGNLKEGVKQDVPLNLIPSALEPVMNSDHLLSHDSCVEMLGLAVHEPDFARFGSQTRYFEEESAISVTIPRTN